MSLKRILLFFCTKKEKANRLPPFEIVLTLQRLRLQDHISC